MLLALVAAILVGGVDSSRAQDQTPKVMPTRDVDITYKITRPNQPATISRRRWLASEHLQRIDGPDKSATIFDRDKQEFTLLNPANRTYRKFEGSRACLSRRKLTRR